MSTQDKKQKGSPATPPFTASVELITPEISSKWLDNSEKFNRGIGQRVLYRYTQAMLEGRWFPTGESIVLNGESGGYEIALDGHHRLAAVRDSGTSQWFVIVRGVPKEAFHYIDHGRGRVFRDTLHVLGMENAPVLAAATSYLTGYNKVNRFTTHGMEDHERWATYQDHPELIQIAGDNYSGKLPFKGVPPGLLAAVHVILHKKDPAAAAEFMELIMQGDDLEENHPVTLYRAYVRKQIMLDVKPSNLPGKFGAGLIEAWNRFRNNERINRLRIPAITPEPI
jgi:hypothetical protein